MDLRAMWKGKGKSKASPTSRPPVNAYASEMFYGLDMNDEPLAMNTTATSKLPSGSALIDCGAAATASAGPEET